MSWNYRIVEHADGSGFGLHRVYYKDGVECSMSAEPCSFFSETAEGLRGDLMIAKMDAHRRPVFQEPEDWTT